MDDYEECHKCLLEEHEGRFCRCEERNMRVGKEQRARGEGPWTKKNINEIKDSHECDSECHKSKTK